MSMKRKCTRCKYGTEECVVGQYYHCDTCDSFDTEVDFKLADDWEEDTQPLFHLPFPSDLA